MEKWCVFKKDKKISSNMKGKINVVYSFDTQNIFSWKFFLTI